jgi:hypothetical protein
MMKHLQDPVPSVLEERDDIPAAVSRVVARAMAKGRDDRYQKVAELVEDLSIASGMTVNRAAPLNTQPPVTTDQDEVTVMRAREELPPAPRRAPVTVPITAPMPAPETRSGFNPLKVLIPSAVALLVVFAAIYALTKDSTTPESTNTNQQTGTLVADPNSQPVQPAQPATGKGEQGIPSGGPITPAANVNASPVASPELSPDPLEDLSPAPNANENANANTNSNRKAPALPEPTRSVVVPESQPSPVPSATKPPERPSPTATPT